MTDRPALATMVIQANPVPDPVATAEHLDAYQSLLALIDERNGAMDHHTQQTDTPTNTPPPPRRNRAAAWAFAAAFILILLVVGAAALLMRGDDAQVTDEPAPPTTANVDNSEGDRLVPKLDTLTWTRVDFTAEDFRDNGGVLVADADNGFLLWDRRGLWKSDDGMSWTFMDVPTEFAEYTVVNLVGQSEHPVGFGLGSSDAGSYVLLSWHDDAWGEVGQLEMPDTVGIEWNLTLDAPIESSGVILARGSLEGSLPWGDIYGRFRKPGCEVCDPKPPKQRWDSATQTIHIVDRFDGSVLASLAFDVVGDTATFRDADTGDVVHEVVGGAEYPIERLIANGFFRSREEPWHMRIKMDGLWVGAPGADFEFHDPAPGEVLAAPDGSGFVAYEVEFGPPVDAKSLGEGRARAWASKPVTGLRTWTSTDGTTWNEGTAPPFPQPSANWVDVNSGVGEIYAIVHIDMPESLGDQVGGAQFWVSPDGVTWTQKVSPTNYRHDFGPYPTAFGYVAWSVEHDPRYWMSLDAESWIEVAGPAGSHGWSTVAGSTLFRANGTDDGDVLWVSRVEPTS